MDQPETTPEVASWRANLLPGLLGVLLVAVLITSGSLIYDRFTTHSEPPPIPAGITSAGIVGPTLGVSAVNVARRASTDFFRLDYRHPDAGGRRLQHYSTSAFRSQYASQVAPLRNQVVSGRLQLVPRLAFNGTATEYLSDSNALVLVSVQLATMSPSGRSQTTEYRTRVTLQRGDDLRWLVAGIDQVN